MLEAFVSSRIRRTLFEYLLTHPNERFYLRGLAKELALSISPLRRELNRLQQSGMLTAVEEGNIRFYTVNTTSPVFLQLQQAGQRVDSPRTAPLQPPALPAPLARQAGYAIPVGVISAHPAPAERFSRREESRPRLAQETLHSVLRGPALIGAAAIGLALTLLVAGLFYLTMTNDRLASAVRHTLTTRGAEVSLVAPQPAASGIMRGKRWQIVPGGFGGFSSGASNESY